MRLDEVWEHAPPVEVAGLAYDTRQLRPGDAFFCVRGFTRDGHDLAPDAVAAGAGALVVDHPLGLGVPEVVVEDVRAAMAPAAARLHGDPTAALRVVGITGTNGKTTTAYLVRELLAAAGNPTGLLGTVTAVVGGQESQAVRTTPEAIDLQGAFARMLAAGDTHCVMEVSSHALQLHRADAIHWAVAVFTNLTRDHLDFHPDMEAYFAAKRRLFTAAPSGDSGTGDAAPGTSVVNVDDPYGTRLARELGDRVVTVGLEAQAQVRASDMRFDAHGATFRLDGVELRSPLPGRFNVLNALCAVATVRALGVDDAAIAAALPGAGRVPGRFEPVDEGQPFAVFVDYAHTPDSLDNVLRAARPLAGGQVWCVFGCGGDRDRDKRPLMGAVACREADRVIVTSDNPRSEEPQAIVDQIVAGAGPPGPGLEIVLDRREAIARALEGAREGDVVVIAGKGHEQGQELAGGVKVPFDDAAVAREALRARLAHA
ncbi:MAG TPA: UDP-N-acetylmuramoyl-L-alanyl-D-glutamate--2,6-diaminopimelate ligase [Solirubrobacteraceae bacterium]|nr:UDP-N-acetylmuramoyl-L-alanyl-D-glutamate--2,6-diaminopimelate ligase [Solirubrobacteraceae bacterium]